MKQANIFYLNFFQALILNFLLGKECGMSEEIKNKNSPQDLLCKINLSDFVYI
jgi:hypothetical protein